MTGPFLPLCGGKLSDSCQCILRRVPPYKPPGRSSPLSHRLGFLGSCCFSLLSAALLAGGLYPSRGVTPELNMVLPQKARQGRGARNHILCLPDGVLVYTNPQPAVCCWRYFLLTEQVGGLEFLCRLNCLWQADVWSVKTHPKEGEGWDLGPFLISLVFLFQWELGSATETGCCGEELMKRFHLSSGLVRNSPMNLQTGFWNGHRFVLVKGKTGGISNEIS